MTSTFKTVSLVAATVIFAAAFVATLIVGSLRDPTTTSDVTTVEQPADTPSTSFNGDDISVLADDDLTVVLCDREADNNPVRVDIDTASGETIVFIDRSGPGHCTQYVASETVLRHRACERNHLRWTCGNYQGTNPAPN